MKIGLIICYWLIYTIGSMIIASIIMAMLSIIIGFSAGPAGIAGADSGRVGIVMVISVVTSNFIINLAGFIFVVKLIIKRVTKPLVQS